MTFAFVGIVLLDGWLDGSLTDSVQDDSSVRGTLLVILVAILMIPALLELSKLAAAKGMKILLPVSIPVSILLSISFYKYFLPVLYLPVISIMACLLYHRIRYGISGVFSNCGAASFSILYLGLLSMFIPAVRINFGPWHLLMFIFVVKCSDIGAYTFGQLFGKHKFSPVISPNKTWEGMAGAVIFAIIVAVVFALSFDIMTWWLGVLFGICFAFIGQMGDLAESMLKRDAETKDASNNVPGFGGILDVVDSILITAPFGYLFFLLVTG